MVVVHYCPLHCSVGNALVQILGTLVYCFAQGRKARRIRVASGYGKVFYFRDYDFDVVYFFLLFCHIYVLSK